MQCSELDCAPWADLGSPEDLFFSRWALRCLALGTQGGMPRATRGTRAAETSELPKEGEGLDGGVAAKGKGKRVAARGKGKVGAASSSGEETSTSKVEEVAKRAVAVVAGKGGSAAREAAGAAAGAAARDGFEEHVRLRLLEVNLVEEKCVVLNRGTRAVDMSGWVLRDEHEKHELALPEGTVVPGGDGRVTVWLCSGRKLGTQKRAPYNEFKGVPGHVCLLNKEGKPRKGYVLNNSGDFLRLYDLEGDLCAIGNVQTPDLPLSPLDKPRAKYNAGASEEEQEEQEEEQEEEEEEEQEEQKEQQEEEQGQEVEEDMINSLLTLLPEGGDDVHGAEARGNTVAEDSAAKEGAEADEDAVVKDDVKEEEVGESRQQMVSRAKGRKRGGKLLKVLLPQLDAEGQEAPSLSPSPKTIPSGPIVPSPQGPSEGSPLLRQSPAPVSASKSKLARGASPVGSKRRQREVQAEDALRLAPKEESLLESLVLLPEGVAGVSPEDEGHAPKRPRMALPSLPGVPQWLEDALVRVWFEARVAAHMGRLAVDDVSSIARSWTGATTPA